MLMSILYVEHSLQNHQSERNAQDKVSECYSLSPEDV